jgi:hypothetical protein
MPDLTTPVKMMSTEKLNGKLVIKAEGAQPNIQGEKPDPLQLCP